MCGIVGKINFDSAAPVERAEITAMLEPIAHRGPDGTGVFLDAAAGLGHCRLAIVDLEGGPQPMTNEDGSIWIVFNGEIYNHAALRETLLAQGHVFHSRSDTEVIVHLYEEHGDHCVDHLRGMFAFAVWDRKRRRLFAARDRVGIKPFYYAHTSTGVVFGSELKAVIADASVPRDLSAPALRLLLAFLYLPRTDTLFSAVHKLMPGHTLVVEGGRVSIQQYWDLRFSRERWDDTFLEAADELRGLVQSSVGEHLMADVPLGVLLSGGLDSSAILSFATAGSGRPVKTFTMGFHAPGMADERPGARRVARHFESEHFEMSMTAEDFWEFLPAYVWHMEEPICEPPAVALYFISRLAAGHVKVLLSGEGGDEAFGGYPNYARMLQIERIAGILGPFSRPAGMMAMLAGSVLGRESVRRSGDALGRPLAEHYFSRTASPSSYMNRRQSFFTTDFAEAARPASAVATMSEVLKTVRGQPLLSRMLYADTRTWLPDDLLVKADKMTMANSVELRVPLLDHRILEFAASLPPAFKVNGGQTKRILRAALSGAVPPSVLERKKAGFPVPYSAWLRGPLADRVKGVLLSERAALRGYFQPGQVERLLRCHRRTGHFSKEVFSLLVTELWHRRFADSSARVAR
jgi:asparagine synthase (glutamine-hydrolysing)